MSDGTNDGSGHAPAADAAPAIDIRDLAYRWHPREPVVLALEELRVERGEQVFIEGPSGSGKSTLLGLLAGINVAGEGKVRVLDRRLDTMGAAARDHFRAHHIGYIFQMFNLIPYLSMVDNVVLPCRFSSRRRERALQRSPSLEAEAVRLLEHLDMDQAAFHRRPVTALSVGQQQRVAAARALMGSPELLIADEPTSSLDAGRRESFLRLLFDECRANGATLVFVSHDSALEELFQRTIRLTEANRAAATAIAARV
ncbi:MAG: ABC transporter ATP-binding protein [Gammaproteobacteria bacterium]|nr:ABC transporter ATP-binding protein [Gammaproteobacteria bacterium]